MDIDIDLFLGFWCKCFDLYNTVELHSGYKYLKDLIYRLKQKRDVIDIIQKEMVQILQSTGIINFIMKI